MDAMPASAAFLALIGVDMGLPETKYAVWCKLFRRLVHLLLYLGMIGFHVYNILYLDTLYLMSVAHILVYGLQLMTFSRILFSEKRILSLLKQTFDALDKKEMAKIRSYDRRQKLLILMFGIFISLSWTAFFLANGIGPETKAIAMALKPQANVPPVYPIAFLILFWVKTVLFSLLIACYISVLNCLQVVAAHVHSRFVQTRSDIYPDFELMLRGLQWYNGLMQSVNEDLGILPFGILGIKFTVFSCGVAFLVSSRDDIKIPVALAALTIGIVNLLYLTFSFQIIEKASKAEKVMSKCWEMAEESVTEPGVTGAESKESQTMRKALKFYLTTEKVVPAKACDAIVMDRSLILSFFAQLIPFTVMLFTTTKEYDRNVSSSGKQ